MSKLENLNFVVVFISGSGNNSAKIDVKLVIFIFDTGNHYADS